MSALNLWLKEGVAALFGAHEWAFLIAFAAIFFIVISANRVLWAWMFARGLSLGQKIAAHAVALVGYIVVITLALAGVGHLLK